MNRGFGLTHKNHTKAIDLNLTYDIERIHRTGFSDSRVAYSFFGLHRILSCFIDTGVRGPPSASSFQNNRENGESTMKDKKYMIADNVKLYRKKQNLTQAKLAELAELSVDAIKRIEAGQRSMSIGNFERISEALQVPTYYLLHGQGEVSELEQIGSILNGRSDAQKEFLLHMLREMAEGTDRLV